MKEYSYEELKNCSQYEKEIYFSCDLLESFIQLSGDTNPLHSSEDYAKENGFDHRVIHGALVISKLSQILGVEYPGKNVIVHKYDISFKKPIFVEDFILFKLGPIEFIDSVKTVILKVTGIRRKEKVFKGKVQVGIRE